jgi:hypothetical protein
MAAVPAGAQTVEHVSLETVVAIDQFRGDNAINRPNIIIDFIGSVRLGSEWQIYVRPWFRQPRTPDWDRQIYQAAVRYEHQGRVATRVDAGYIGSPVGLGLADSTPSTNPTIAPHLSYFTPMLPFDTGGPRVNAIASSYPLGAQVTWSTDRWDVRGALVDSTPTRIYVIGGGTNPAHTPVIEGGAGITPKTGVRLGVSFAHGAYLRSRELSSKGLNDRQMTMVGVEGEYAFGYTKLSGELLRDRFDTAAATATAYEWFIQGTQTLSPRWFVAARHEGTSPPVRTNVPSFKAQPQLRIVEATLGFRITREIMVRGSYFTRLFYGRTTWDRQAGAQLVWSRRWW